MPARSETDAEQRTPSPRGVPLMTAQTLEELRSELERLRRTTRDQLEQRLREARPYGVGSNNDEYHAVREEQMVLEARLAALEETIARAVVIEVDSTAPDVAVIGSTVTIEDVESGSQRRYRLASAHQERGPDLISAASPMGQALLGARTGNVLTVELPSGRSRRIRLVSVKTPPPVMREA
jgi:transcription elongation factor GreA